MGVQKVRWHSGTKAVDEYTFSYGKGTDNQELGTGFFNIRE
jgi:hypothetical protein